MFTVPDGSIAAPFSMVRKRPRPSKDSSENPIGSIRLWQGAHIGTLAKVAAYACRLLCPGCGMIGCNNGELGGGGIGWQRSLWMTNVPRPVGNVSGGLEVRVNSDAWVSKPDRTCGSSEAG